MYLAFGLKMLSFIHVCGKKNKSTAVIHAIFYTQYTSRVMFDDDICFGGGYSIEGDTSHKGKKFSGFQSLCHDVITWSLKTKIWQYVASDKSM